ncbi:hypothetical protein B0H17DRAFT_1134289 [Mycena rosella]|uniref:Uncharacterized protein n=1 Tax=Mycena rosella TaxID=1033263 RepID=A0AAD7DFN3_MYCRO|nr:hypothetical protein B0H17DRAFT_1134289 [Mycena rosella]
MPKTQSSPRAKPQNPYRVSTGKIRGLLAQPGQATLENISALQQTGMKKHGKAEVTTKKYDQVIAATRKWLTMSLGGKTAQGTKGKTKSSTTADEDSDSDSDDDDDDDFADGPEGPDSMAPDVGEPDYKPEDSTTDESFKFDAPEFKNALDDTPNEHSPKVLALYLVYKIFHQGKKIQTADTARAAWKRLWKFVDGDTFRGRWHYNTANSRWEGNPVDSSEVEDTMESIKNKCGKDDGERKHSLAMTEEFMERIFGWSDKVCPPSSYNSPSKTHEQKALKTKHLEFKAFASTAWTVWSRNFELVKLQEKDLSFGLQDPRALNAPYFELHLTNRKGWQKRINKTKKETDLRSGRYKICSQPDLPACDAYHWLPKWRQYLQDEVYERPLRPDDYIFPAIGANGVVQVGEHLSHDDVNKWIKEFAAGADLPQQNGTFSTHCFRRGSAQYRIMFAPIGRRWTLRQVRWWGGWAEGEHRDTLVKYLLDELYTYEDDYSGMLLPMQPAVHKSFLGEASVIAPATTEQLSLLYQSLSGDMRTMAGMMSSFVNSIVSLHNGPISSAPVAPEPSPSRQPYFPFNQSPIPGFFSPFPSAATRALVPIQLPTATGALVSIQLPGAPHPSPMPSSAGRPLPTPGLIVPDIPVLLPDGSRSLSRDSWRIVVQHWLTGDSTHGLYKPLKDWPKEHYTGVNKCFQMKRHNRMVIATEFITRHNSDDVSFLAAYPEANEGLSKLLAAVTAARRARGEVTPRK